MHSIYTVLKMIITCGRMCKDYIILCEGLEHLYVSMGTLEPVF